MLPPSIEFPRFRPRAPWWGPDLQTLRNTFRGPAITERALRPVAQIAHYRQQLKRFDALIQT